MKKLANVYIIIFIIALFGFNFSLLSQQKEKIIKGEVVDVLTFLSTGKSGPAMKDAMLESSKNGNQLGILSGGKIYIVMLDDKKAKINDQLVPFLCDKIVAKGKVFSKAGLNVIILSNIDKDMRAK
jgi:hypothetical protein